MQNKRIAQLNRRFAEALGSLGNQGRFSWQYAGDLRFYDRDSSATSWVEHNWAERIGKVWVLTMLRPPVGLMGGIEVPITEQDWFHAFRGTRPFPGKLAPYVFAETALIPGLEPSEEKTAFYIDSLEEQLAKSVRQLTIESYDSCEAARLAHKKEFMALADDSFPAFWSSKGGAHTPGTRGGHVAFQR